MVITNWTGGADGGAGGGGEPSGSASGDLAGTYPGPSVAAITETSGPTSLVVGVIADGQTLRRTGATIEGYAPSGGSPNVDTGNTLWVDKVFGNDGTAVSDRQDLPWATIGAALTAAVTGDTVRVRGGTYTESGLTVLAGVACVGDGLLNTIVGDASATADIFTLAAGSLLQGFRITLPAPGSASPIYAGVKHAAGTGTLYDLDLRGDGGTGKGTGIYKTGAGKIVGGNIRCEGGGLAALLRVDAAVLALDDVHVPGSAGTIEDVVLVQGTGRFQGQGVNIGNSGVVDCLHVEGTGIALIYSPNWANAAIGAHIADDGVSVTVIGGKIDPTVASLLIDSGLSGTGSSLTLSGTTIQPLFSFPSVALATMDLAASFHQEATATRRAESRVVGSDFVTGFPELGSGMMVGEGSAYSDGLKVVTSDSTATSTTLGGNLTDETVAAKSVDGSTFTFQGTAADHCIYFGTTRVGSGGAELKHWGLSLSQAAAGVGGSYVVEIWDGAAWVAIGVMATSQDESHRYANALCVRASSVEFWAYGIDAGTTWATISVDGTTAYWVRLRVDTTLTTEPTFERTWLVPSHVMLNAQGQLAARGLAAWHTSIAASGIQWSGSGLGNGVEAVGTGGGAWIHELDRGLLNGNNDQLFAHLLLPRGICTAFPVSVKLVYGYHAYAGAPTLEGRSLVVERAGILVADGTNITPAARSEADTAAVNSVAGLIQPLSPSTSDLDKVFTLTYGPVDISGHYAGDMVLFNLVMTSDGGGSDILVWAIEVEGVAFSHGDVL